MKRLFAACIALLFAFSLRADTIVFHNGEKLEGNVLEKDENTIKLEVEFGTVLVPMTRVRRIDADTPEKLAERERRKAEAKEEAERMLAEGKVRYKGKWVTEDEKKADEEKVAEEKKKKKELAEAAKKKAEEAAAKAKEAQAKLAAEQALQNAQNGNNSRNDRFSRRHNRDDLTNQGLNGNNNSYNNGSSYNNNYGNSNNGNVINNSGYRGR